jgi:hypothetical protein
MAAFMSITREQYNKSLPVVAGAAVGTYNSHYAIVDKDIRVRQYGTQDKWDNHMKT